MFLNLSSQDGELVTAISISFCFPRGGTLQVVQLPMKHRIYD